MYTANKKAGSGDAGLYHECRRLAATRAQWYYETTGPGSGLPVLSTLKDMTQSGDVVERVSGRFSGSISYIFSQLRSGVPLSEALAEAAAKGLTEPDPRDDLNGVDNARCLVVLGRRRLALRSHPREDEGAQEARPLEERRKLQPLVATWLVLG